MRPFIIFLLIANIKCCYSFKVDCNNIDTEVDLGSIVNQCMNAESLSGKGVVNLNVASERQLYNFFVKKKFISVVLYMDSRSIVTHLNLGNVHTVGKANEDKVYLYIVNTKLKQIIAPKLQRLFGGKVRGNRLLTFETLHLLRRKKDARSNIQEAGECNYVLPEIEPDFNCPSANYLYLNDGEEFPSSFVPSSIGGCVRLRYIKAEHNFFEKMNLEDVNNFDCDMGMEQAIEHNNQLCLKEFEYNLYSRNIVHKNNSNPSCKFRCYEGWLSYDKVNDISHFYQKWCETLEGDLTIDEELVANSNIAHILRNLKTIRGSIIISNLTNVTTGPYFNETLDVIEFPSLEFVLGSDYADIMVLVENTTLKKLLFPKIKQIKGGDKTFVIRDSNPYLKMTEEEMANIEAATNSRAIQVPKKLTHTEEKEEEPEKEEENGNTTTWIVVGSVSGALVLVVVVVVLTVVFVIQRKRKNRKTKPDVRNATGTEPGSKYSEYVSINQSNCAKTQIKTEENVANKNRSDRHDRQPLVHAEEEEEVASEKPSVVKTQSSEEVYIDIDNQKFENETKKKETPQKMPESSKGNVSEKKENEINKESGWDKAENAKTITETPVKPPNVPRERDENSTQSIHSS